MSDEQYIEEIFALTPQAFVGVVETFTGLTSTQQQVVVPVGALGQVKRIKRLWVTFDDVGVFVPNPECLLRVDRKKPATMSWEDYHRRLFPQVGDKVALSDGIQRTVFYAGDRVGLSASMELTPDGKYRDAIFISRHEIPF
jgi:hypothetical protein